MMNKIIFLSVQEIIHFHSSHIILFGGSHGIRDLNLLESAVYEPQVSFGGNYLYTNIFEMASAYTYSLIKNHPFIDGNKRIGVLSGVVFLKSNDVPIKLSQEQFYSIGVDIAKSSMSREECARIFRINSEI